MSTQYLSQAQVERFGPENIAFACKDCANVRFMKRGPDGPGSCLAGLPIARTY